MAVIGYSAILKLDPGTGTYAVIGTGETTTITLPAGEYGSVEASHLGVTNKHKAFVPGLADGGMMDFEMNYDKATLNALLAVKGKVKVTSDVKWQITLPDDDGAGANTALVCSFVGFLTKTEVSIEAEAVMKIKGSVKVTGEITYA